MKTAITKIEPINMALVEYGVALTILSIVLLLLFLYFRKLINQKSLVERLFDAQNTMLGNIVIELHRIKEDLVDIRATLRGGFRTRGRDDD